MGNFYHVNSAEDLHGRFLQAGDEVGLTKDSDNDTIPDWVEEKGYIIKDTLGKVIEPTNPNNEDSDGDGLLDRHELGDWYYNQETGKVYLARLVGDPNSPDTDNDGKPDEKDIFPRIPKVVPVVLIHGINDNSRKVWGLETFISNSDYEDSKRKKITDDKGKSLYSLNKGFTSGYFRAQNQLVSYSDINTQYIYAYYKNNKIGKYLIGDKQYEPNKDLFVFNWENNHHIDVMAGELEGFLNNLSNHFKENGQKENVDIFNEDNIAEFNLVGHSAGGVISRFYVENLMDDHDPMIKKLITLNTPHFGSGLASVGANVPLLGGGAATAGCSNVLDDLRVTGSYLHTSDEDKIKGCKDKSNAYLQLDHPYTEYNFIGGFVVDPDGSNKGIEINPYLEKDVYINPLNETVVDLKHEELIYSKGILDEKISYGPTSAIIAAAGRYGDEVVSIYSQLGIPTDSQIKYSEDIKNDRWNGYTPLQNVHRHIYFGAHNVAEHNEITKEKEVQKLIIEILER